MVATGLSYVLNFFPIHFSFRRLVPFYLKPKNIIMKRIMTFLISVALLLGWGQIASQAPVFEWALGMGGMYTSDLAVDASGNIYTTGEFWGTADFDPGPGTFYLTSKGYHDIYIQKLDSEGNFLWACGFGSDNVDGGISLTVGPGGNVVVVGTFCETVDFDPGPGVVNLTSNGHGDIFVIKMDGMGNLLWAKSVGGSSVYDRVGSVRIDLDASVVLVGHFSSTVDFDPGPGEFELICEGEAEADGYILKLDVLGNFLWVGHIGGSGWNVVSSVAIDHENNILLSGSFEEEVDLDPGPGIFMINSYEEDNDFVVKLTNEGAFLWGRSIENLGNSSAPFIQADQLGNAIICGQFRGAVDFNPGSGTFMLGEAETTYSQTFLLRLDEEGNFGGAVALGNDGGGVTPRDMVLDEDQNIYVTGTFSGTVDFDPSPLSLYLTSNDIGDIFISKIKAVGSLAWAFKVGAEYDDVPFSIFIDPNNTLYLTGRFRGEVDFDPGPGIFDLYSGDSYFGFITKWSQPPSAITATRFPSTASIYPNPTTGYFNLDLGAVYEGITVEISTPDGRTIQQESSKTGQFLELEVNGPPGLYFVRVSLADGCQIVKKLIRY
jgi:hypothetical protein